MAAANGAALAVVLLALLGGRRARAVAAMSCLSAVSVPALELLARRYAPMGGGAWRYPLAFERGLTLVLLLTAAVLLCIRVVRTLGTVGVRPVAPTPPIVPAPVALSTAVPEESVKLPRRAALAAIGVGTFSVLRGGLRERHDLQLNDVTLTVSALPPSLDGVTLIHLSDLHIGLFTGAQELEQMLRVVRRARGDIVVLTGDVMDNNPEHISEGMRALAALHAPLGVYAILGNHDHLTGGAKVAAGMRSVGIQVMVNASVRIAPNGREGITLAGVDDFSAIKLGGGPNLGRALRGRDRDEPRVLLAHNPVLFQDYAGEVAVQLSGHTHGGQINPLGLHLLRVPYIAGRYFEKSSVLYVSRGIGITGPPLRLNCPPEVVRVTLRS